MLVTAFLAIVFCAAITIMLLSAVAFIQDKKYSVYFEKEGIWTFDPSVDV